MTIMCNYLGKQGRLGNTLFQIASTLGIAHDLGEDAEFNHWDYEDYFSVPKELFKDNPQGTPVTNYPTHMPESERVFLQDYNLFSSIEDQIREYFKPSEETLKELRHDRGETLEGLLHNALNRKIVAVHYRGDERPLIQNTHPTPPKKYYLDAMDMVDGPDVQFWIFSDSPETARQVFGPTFKYVSYKPRWNATYQTPAEGNRHYDYQDLFLMTWCQKHIITNSTYSWWGAFLSENRQPIYPGVWYGESFQHIDASLQFPPTWRKLDW